MSVIFSAEPQDPYAFTISCGCDPATAEAHHHDTYQAASDAFVSLRATAVDGVYPAFPGCPHPDDCRTRTPMLLALRHDPGPDITVVYSNAVALLVTLGYLSEDDPADEIAGEADPGDFLGRVLIALALAPHDPGTPATDTTPRWRVLGREPGHLQRLLVALEEIARWCRDHGRRIHWA